MAKKSAFCLAVQKTRKYMQLSTFGHTQDITASQVEVATQFVGELYGSATCQSLNKLRCEKVQKKNVSTRKLPPTDDSFMQHLLHAKYQLLIWEQANTGMQLLPDLNNYGYTFENSVIHPVMMTISPAAPELLSELVCCCQRNECSGEGCCCFMNDQPCTVACGCEAWVNTNDEDGACGNPLTYIVYCREEHDQDDDINE